MELKRKNDWLLISTVDNNWNTCYLSDDGGKENIEIEEFQERINDMLEGITVFTDMETYQLFGSKNPYKAFTYVFSDHADPYNNMLDKSIFKDYRFARHIHFDKLDKMLENNAKYSSQPLAFIFTSGPLLEKTKGLIDQIYLCKVDTEFETGFNKFPKESFSYLNNIQVNQSKISQAFKNSDSGLVPSDQEITIMNEYFKKVKRTPKRKKERYSYKFVNIK